MLAPGETGLPEFLDTPFYDIEVDDDATSNEYAQIKQADFIAWDESFFDMLGPNAKVEKIHGFPGTQHVHEAPVYITETNELLFADTSVVGWLWAIDVDTYQVWSWPGTSMLL